MAHTARTSPDTVYTTLGCKVSYAWEETADERPTTGYEIIWDCIQSPSIGGEPDEVETTTLTATKNKTYTQLLQELSDKAIVCNATDAAFAIHKDMLETKATNQAASPVKCMWVCVDIAMAEEAFFVRCMPADKNMAAQEPNAKVDVTIPLEIIGDWQDWDKPTYSNLPAST